MSQITVKPTPASFIPIPQNGSMVVFVDSDLIAKIKYDDGSVVPIGRTSEWYDSVLSIQTTPPGSPIDGDRYLVGPSGAAGLWTGKENQIAQWSTDAGWLFMEPTDRGSLRVNDNPDLGIAYYDGTFPSGVWVFEEQGSGGVRYLVPVGVTASTIHRQTQKLVESNAIPDPRGRRPAPRAGHDDRVLRYGPHSLRQVRQRDGGAARAGFRPHPSSHTAWVGADPWN